LLARQQAPLETPCFVGISVAGIGMYQQKYRQIVGISCYHLKPCEARKNPLSNEEGGF
jgi:hypothetical protein